MKHIILASASAAATACSPAHAQTAPDGSASQGASPVGHAKPDSNAPQGGTPSPISEPHCGLQDIIVTAQRTQKSAQKTPIAIAVIKPEELIRQNVTRSDELSRIVPALVATPGGDPNTSFYIRGVGNSTNNAYSDPAISFNYDGVYVGRRNSTQGFF